MLFRDSEQVRMWGKAQQKFTISIGWEEISTRGGIPLNFTLENIPT